MALEFGIQGNAFHDWLSTSGYVTGPDQTSRILSRKKHRSKSKSDVSGSEEAKLDTERRARELWKLSNRRYRRWMNDRLLRELAPPMDAHEIGSLFAPPPWGERSVPSPFEKLTELGDASAQDKAAWEPFRNNVDMDMEAIALKEKTRPPRDKHDSNVMRRNATLVAWRSIEHQPRDAIRRSSSWHLVRAFEEKILEFFTDLERGGLDSLELEVNDPYHRMLLHGVSQFYGLLSQSMSALKEGENSSIPSFVTRVWIKKKQDARPGVARNLHAPFTLMQFLEEAKNKASFAAAAG